MKRQIGALVLSGLLVGCALWLGTVIYGLGTVVIGGFTDSTRPVVSIVVKVLASDIAFLAVAGGYLAIREQQTVNLREGLSARGLIAGQHRPTSRMNGLSTSRCYDKEERSIETVDRSNAGSNDSDRAVGVRAEIHRLFITELPPSVKGSIVLIGYLMLLALRIIAGLVYSVLGIAPPTREIVGTGSQYPVFAILIPLSLFVIAPCEEFFFRRTVQSRLGRGFGRSIAIGITSVLFALSHSGTVSGSAVLWPFFWLTLIGAILGTAYEITDDLLVPILIHGCYNGTLFAFALALALL